MGTEHVVRQGECISSIAEEYGLMPEAIWNDGANAELKAKRKDPNVLHPGDRLVIREKVIKEASKATEKRHRFVRKGTPAKLRLRFLCDDQPIANEPYELDLGNRVISGKTKPDGWLEEAIPPGLTHGSILIGKRRFPLSLGHVDPATEVTGAQTRLRNLGYYAGAVGGDLDEETGNALRAFQKKMGIPETGKLDPGTQSKLLSEHGG